MDGLTRAEHALFKKLSTPGNIQDFLDTLPINHERRGETCRSPRNTLKAKRAHCLEGAFLAAAALTYHKKPALLMNLKTAAGDDDHAVVLFKHHGRFGALSKTNHAVLRYRDPVYASPRELALSYFHEYFLNKTGRKTLVAYSKPFDMKRCGKDWITSEKDLWKIAYALRASPHVSIVPKGTKLRRASAIERETGAFVEWG